VPDKTRFHAIAGLGRRLPDRPPALTGAPASVRAWPRWSATGTYPDPEAWPRTVARPALRWRRRLATAATRVESRVAGLVREVLMALALAGVLVITVVTAWLVAS
jgi:hypothetical protein